MNEKLFTLKEWIYFFIRNVCEIWCLLPMKLGNWATDKLNSSYYKK